MIPLIASAAAIAALVLVTGRNRGRSNAFSRLERLRPGGTGTDHDKSSARIRGAGPSIFERVSRLLPGRLARVLERGLPEHAGLSDISVGELAGIRAVGTIALPLAAALVLGLSSLCLFAVPAAAAAGYYAPVFVATRKQRRQLEALRGALPRAADIMYASVLGGRNLDKAFRSAASSASEPLRAVLSTAVAEMDLGASRAEAFDRLVERCPLPELAALLRTLIESERRGYPLSHTLEVFSREIRLRRRDELRCEAAKAPVRLLAPLVFLILPASVILTVGPTFLIALRRGI